MTPDSDRETVTKPIVGERIGLTVAAAISEATDREMEAIPPLYDSVDPDALSTIVLDRAAEVNVEFEHAGCRVIVANGSVTAEAL